MITPDQAMVFDGKAGGPGQEAQAVPQPTPERPYSSSDVWPAAVGVDQFWPTLAWAERQGRRQHADDRLRRLGDRGLAPSRFRRPRARGGRPDVAAGQLARRRSRARDDGRRPRRGLRAGSRRRRAHGGDRLARRDGRPRHGAHERRDRRHPVDPAQPQAVRHPRRELLAPLGEPVELPLGPARQGGRKALVSGVVVVAASGNQAPGRPADADGLRAGERPLCDHGRRARPAQLHQPGPRRRRRRGRPGATRSTASRSPSCPPPAARSSARCRPARRSRPSSPASCIEHRRRARTSRCPAPRSRRRSSPASRPTCSRSGRR